MGFDDDDAYQDRVAFGNLLAILQRQVDEWRKEADDYTAVMYYNEGDRETDNARRLQKVMDADTLQSILEGFYYN